MAGKERTEEMERADEASDSVKVHHFELGID